MMNYAEKIKVGDFVKLRFHSNSYTEKMWVIVKKIRLNNLIGILNNDPVLVDMKCGDKIKFTLDEVLDVIKDTDG